VENKIPNCPRCGAKLIKVKDKNYYGCPSWLPDNKGCEGTIWWPGADRKKTFPNVVFSIKIESKSQPGHFHQVKIYETGDINCPCVAGQMAKFCDHKRKAIKVAEDLIAKIKKENGL
jgi:ssDNA-binding Zn-finger/Zn-ribbon topoisomerase 1